MEAERDINFKILGVIMQIEEKYPELSKFLDEMPITIPNEVRPTINIRLLNDYYESLSSMLKRVCQNPLTAMEVLV
jgi:hypothetical protein